MPDYRIVDFPASDETLRAQAAALLVEAFAEHAPNAWPTLADGLEEIAEALEDERICRAALAADGTLLGWIGALPAYDHHTWELHPLAVVPARQRQGIGRALVRDLEACVYATGGRTLMLGTDDESNMTSLSAIDDLYADIPGHIARIEDRAGHPFAFYRRCGYTVVGIIPDANGPRKPDIIMARRLDAPQAGMGA